MLCLCHIVNPQLKEAAGMLMDLDFLIINKPNENQKTILCYYYSPFIPSVTSNVLSSIDFPIESWLSAHTETVFVTFLSLSSIQLPKPEL